MDPGIAPLSVQSGGPPQCRGSLLALKGEAQLCDGLLGGFCTGLSLPQDPRAALACPRRRPLLCLCLSPCETVT